MASTNSQIRVQATCSSCGTGFATIVGPESPTVSCPSCNRPLAEAFLVGFVYLLTNPSMPGLVKIGSTMRRPHLRIDELTGTGVPSPFELEAYWWSKTPEEDERLLHRKLKDARVSKNREFFRITLLESMNAFSAHFDRAPEYASEGASMVWTTAGVHAAQPRNQPAAPPYRFVVDSNGNVYDKFQE